MQNFNFFYTKNRVGFQLNNFGQAFTKSESDATGIDGQSEIKITTPNHDDGHMTPPSPHPSPATCSGVAAAARSGSATLVDLLRLPRSLFLFPFGLMFFFGVKA